MSDQDGPGIFEVFGEPPEVDPNRFGPVPVVPEDAEAAAAKPAARRKAAPQQRQPEQRVADTGGAGLPHWTAPPTGQVPPVLASDADGEVWTDLSGPRWRGEGSGWADDDLQVVFGDEKAVEHEDIMHFEEPRLARPRPQADAEPQIIPDPPATPAPPTAADAVGRAPRRKRVAAPKAEQQQQTQQAAQQQTQAAPAAKAPRSIGGGRDLGQAVAVGVGLAAIAAAAILIHPLAGLALIAIVALVATVEFFDALRRVGHNPATLLGLTGSVLLPAAAYWRGESAYAVIGALTIVFGAIWYIVGADTIAPARNLGLTQLGIMWIGGLAGFGAMTLRLDDGAQILLGAILLTAIYDTAAYFGGKTFGKKFFGDRQFHPASQKKTWEGTIAGVLAAMAVGAIFGAAFSYDTSLWHVIALGAVVGTLATLGDLFESLLKRDMQLKDMSSLLPGHGGILDRVDGLLFVLPGVYFLARLLDYV